MAQVEVISGSKPYYTVRITIGDGRAFDQPVYVDAEAGDVPLALADYAAAMEAEMPPVAEG